MAQGGLEGCKPSKNPSFLVLVLGKAGNEHQKLEISGRQRLPEPLHHVTTSPAASDPTAAP
jgi:hypothetical protein